MHKVRLLLGLFIEFLIVASVVSGIRDEWLLAGTDSRSGRAVGTVTHINSGRSRVAEYTFQVGGQTFRGRTSLPRHYSSGPIEITYDLANPQQSCPSESGSRWPHRLGLLVMGAGVLVAIPITLGLLVF